jgi:hypothetical protein
MLLGGCGLFQTLFIFLAQAVFGVNNYFVLIFIPMGIIAALFYGTVIIFESFAQVRRRKRLRSQFQVRKEQELYKMFLNFPVTKPLLILMISFSLFFLMSYGITIAFLDGQLAFVIAENVAAVLFLLLSNAIEKYYANIGRY